jgi:hypothetical protein
VPARRLADLQPGQQDLGHPRHSSASTGTLSPSTRTATARIDTRAQRNSTARRHRRHASAKRSLWASRRAEGTTDRKPGRFTASWIHRRDASALVMAHETPGDPLVRALPSPVCTGPAASQSRWQEILTDRSECPAQLRYTIQLPITNVQGLLAAFPSSTSAVCCPSAACRGGQALSW